MFTYEKGNFTEMWIVCKDGKRFAVTENEENAKLICEALK